MAVGPGHCLPATIRSIPPPPLLWVTMKIDIVSVFPEYFDVLNLSLKDPEQLKRLDAFDDYRFGGTALVGDPTDPDMLRQGGIENCDAVAAVSEDDTVNLMAAQIARSIFRKEKVICRVSDPHLQVLYHKAYELDTICPTVLTEQAVFRALAK